MTIYAKVPSQFVDSGTLSREHSSTTATTAVQRQQQQYNSSRQQQQQQQLIFAELTDTERSILNLTTNKSPNHVFACCKNAKM